MKERDIKRERKTNLDNTFAEPRNIGNSLQILAVRVAIDLKIRLKRNSILYVQEVVTPQKKYLIHLHQKMRFTPFIN